NHGIGADTADIAAAAINAGVDMDMVSESYRHALPALVRSGRVSQATLDEAVRRVLRMKYRLGLYRDPYHGATVQGEASAMLTPASRALAREAARESIVLLKNDGGVLPLRKDVKTVAVIGALAEDASAALGNWTGQARHEDAVSVLAGIRAALPGANVVFSRGASVTSDTTGIADAVAAARRADAVILVVGEVPDMSAEASSRATIDVPGAQMKLVRAVRAATSAPTVVVLMNGRPLAMQELNDVSPAIVESWFLGVEHGNAVADVIFGDYNPSGKLPVTFPRVTGQEPIYYAHKNTGRPSNDRDKYVSRYLDVSYTPLYVFGHGLSYTTFTIGAPQLGAATMGAGDTLHVRVSVTNSGRMVGTEVVQLYLRDDVSSATRPVRELRGFQRVTLAPGESRVVDFAIDARDLAFHDAGMRRVVEPGTFTVFVGNSSAATQSARLTFTSANGQPVAMAAGCPVVR
ncbi:MAG: glycosyl hydrolase, partial [Gemmatimonadaceae bacterium]|nr:glycosyl hydrolase [Gemmatimonadaceae bacterium]